MAVIQGSLTLLSSWREAQVVQHQTNNPPSTDKWMRPQVGWSKCNVDRALFTDFAAISVVYRDATSRMTSAYVQPGLPFSRSEVVEALGVREALSWIHDRRRSYVVVETDCLQVVQALTQTK